MSAGSPPSSPSQPPERTVPLCVDLDGTLIHTDLLWEGLSRLFIRNPLWLLAALFWWTRGRAYLKRRVVARVKIDPEALPYNREFLAYLREAKKAGRELILVTASDRELAVPVAKYLGIFDEVMASDGVNNLRGARKLEKLVEEFGQGGFDYAGNSRVDLSVWKGAREAIVVSASARLTARASKLTRLGPTFVPDYSRFDNLKRFLGDLFIGSRYAAAIAAGLVMSAAFPKIGIAGLAWIAPGLMVGAAYGRSGMEAFRIGYVAGLAYWLASLYWLLLMPVAGLPVLGWFALCTYLALYPAAWVRLLCGKIGQGGWAQRNGWALAGAAIWVGLEMIRARLLSGFPWSPLGVSQFRIVPLIQIASLTGVYGVSFLVVWLSLSLCSAALAIVRRPAERRAWSGEVMLPLVTVLAVFSLGVHRVNHEDSSGPTLRAALVQPSIPQTLIWDEAEDERRFTDLLNVTAQALTNHPDLLVWPEGVVPHKIRYNEEMLRSITGLARSNHLWMIISSDDAEPAPDAKTANDMVYYNASFLINPEGQLVDRYCKRNLVIFGEYVPLSRWLPFLRWLSDMSDVAEFSAGDKVVPFDLTGLGVRTATLICFEDVFPQLAREYAQDDVDFLVNLTNDGWFGESAEQWQHAASAVFRAVENGLPLIRCCNNGLTCWVDSRGRLRQVFRDRTGSEYGAGFLLARIPGRAPGEKRPGTFYNAHGDWFGWGCVALSVLAVPLAALGAKPKATRSNPANKKTVE